MRTETLHQTLRKVGRAVQMTETVRAICVAVTIVLAAILAVKLQEVFGLQDTPRIARGRVPVLMHLLAPNRRPVQVTTDLRNFWNQTYQEVRKELRARYPKHPWPEDPWTAPPKKGTKRRKR